MIKQNLVMSLFTFVLATTQFAYADVDSNISRPGFKGDLNGRTCWVFSDINVGLGINTLQIGYGEDPNSLEKRRPVSVTIEAIQNDFAERIVTMDLDEGSNSLITAKWIMDGVNEDSSLKLVFDILVGALSTVETGTSSATASDSGRCEHLKKLE